MKNTKLKIGLVYGNLNVGGGTYQLLSLANILAKNNEVTVFVYKDLTKGNYVKLTKQIRIVETPGNIKSNNSILGVLFEPFIVSFNLAKLISRYEIDVLNPHEWPANWACSMVKIIKKVSIIWMCNDVWHLPNFSTEKRIRFKIFKNTFIKVADLFLSIFIDRIVVLDNRIKGIVENYYHKKTMVVRSGLDIKSYKNKIDHAIVRAELGININQFVFVCFSIFFPHRRFEDAIEAFKKIYVKNSNLRLMILGSSQFDPDYFLKIKALITDYGLQSVIKLNNTFLSDDLIKKYLSSSDVFIFPNEKQTWGLAVIEAMALGKPCIVSDSAGVHEIVDDGKNGLIFRCGDVEDLSKKMDKLIKNEKLREQIGKNAKEFVFSNYSWENYAKSMLNIFQEVAK